MNIRGAEEFSAIHKICVKYIMQPYFLINNVFEQVKRN